MVGHLLGMVALFLLLVSCNAPQADQNAVDAADELKMDASQEAPDNSPPRIPRVYSVSTDDIRNSMEYGVSYLRGVQHPEHGGMHKYYYPTIDELEPNLYTVYTASFALALLNQQEGNGVPIDATRAADFLLKMQNTEEGDLRRGAFAYMYALETEEKEERYVVGTTSKAIYTLIELHERTSEDRYLQAAELGGDWLLTMILPAGNVKSYTRLNEDGRWVSGSSDSTLYNGQVLSALSRLYSHTGQERYLEGARKITSYFLQKVDREGCYVGDGYRDPNPISSAWILYSLIDFNTAQPDPSVEYLILNCARELLDKQLTDTSDLRRYGRWSDSFSTSGTSWIAEVLVEVYEFCEEQGERDCNEFRDAIVRAIRWLLQHTYSDAYAAHLPNPSSAIGGLFWGPGLLDRYIRTDSVSHALNVYSGILPLLQQDGVLLDVTPR